MSNFGSTAIRLFTHPSIPCIRFMYLFHPINPPHQMDFCPSDLPFHPAGTTSNPSFPPSIQPQSSFSDFSPCNILSLCRCILHANNIRVDKRASRPIKQVLPLHGLLGRSRTGKHEKSSKKLSLQGRLGRNPTGKH